MSHSPTPSPIIGSDTCYSPLPTAANHNDNDDDDDDDDEDDAYDEEPSPDDDDDGSTLLADDSCATDSIQRVHGHVYISSQVVAQQHALLREHDIKHVLSVTPYAIPTFPDTVNYLVIPLLDIVSANLLEHLDACLAFIDAAVARRENVLVHCRAGVSRSASVVIAWCMRALGYSLPRAVAYVQAVRPIIEPNAGFMLQLQLFSELGNRVPDGDTRVAFLQWRLANRHQGDALAIGMSSSTR